jgi:ABC-type multidrug transport system fused ATPase/permease subunit
MRRHTAESMRRALSGNFPLHSQWSTMTRRRPKWTCENEAYKRQLSSLLCTRIRSATSRKPLIRFSKQQWSYNNVFSTQATGTHLDTRKDNDDNQQIGSLSDESSNGKKNLDSLRRLTAFSKPEHSHISWSAATLLVTSSSTLIYPTASGKVLDMILSGDPTVSPTLVAVGLFALTAVAGAGVYARTLWLQQAGNTLAARLKGKLYQSILQQEVAYFDKTKTGDLMTRLSNDTSMIQNAVTIQSVAALRAIVMTTGSAVMLFQTSTTLALVSLGTLPPLFLAARQVGQTLREKQRHVQDLQSHASSLAEEGLNGIRTVVQFGAQALEVQRYREAATNAHQHAIAIGRTQASFDAAVHVAANGATLCVLGYGGHLVMAGAITVGDLTGFLLYSLLLAGNVSSLSGTYAEVLKAVAAADRVWEILDRSPVIPSTSTHNSLRNTYTQSFKHPLPVEFRNVHFAYPTRPEKSILGPGFSLKIKPGEVMAIVGGSGSGKSTVASLLTRLYDIDIPDSGDADSATSAILVNNIDIRDWDPNVLRQSVIGIVSQEPWLLDASIAENIRYGRPTATDEEVEEAAKLANVTPFAQTFAEGLHTQVGPRGTQLSGGQKQRVAIARLIVKDPPVIILDEATSALDAQSEYLVKQAIDSAMKGRTVISIAHRLSTISGADRIAVLQEGQISEVGTFQELSQKESGAFRALMGRQLISTAA